MTRPSLSPEQESLRGFSSDFHVKAHLQGVLDHLFLRDTVTGDGNRSSHRPCSYAGGLFLGIIMVMVLGAPSLFKTSCFDSLADVVGGNGIDEVTCCVSLFGWPQQHPGQLCHNGSLFSHRDCNRLSVTVPFIEDLLEPNLGHLLFLILQHPAGGCPYYFCVAGE